MVKSYFQPLYVRIDNNTNDQDYIPDDGEIDGRDRTQATLELKTEPTREKRLATTLEWLAEGKRRNWKYENC